MEEYIKEVIYSRNLAKYFLRESREQRLKGNIKTALNLGHEAYVEFFRVYNLTLKEMIKKTTKTISTHLENIAKGSCVELNKLVESEADYCANTTFSNLPN